jgi:hypothetical protein
MSDQPERRSGIGADLDSFEKARRAIGEDRADADAIIRHVGDLLVRAGPGAFDAFASAIRERVVAENDAITSGPKFKIEYDMGRVMEVSLRTITCHLRFNPGAFADALGARPPYLNVTLGPNPRIAAFDPSLKHMMAPTMGEIKEPPVRRFDVSLITEDGNVLWRVGDDLLSSEQLAGDLVGLIAKFYKVNAPSIRRP